MSRTFISDEEIDKALDYLRDNADAAAQCRAERVYLEEYRKSLKAILMKESPKDSAVIQERNAYSDQRYLDHLLALKEAVFKDEKHRFLRAAAEAKCDAWRTQSSNERAMKI
jgi:hypothetical protein